jgi:hypothetical protein
MVLLFAKTLMVSTSRDFLGYLSPDRSVAWETVIAAFGMISQVGPSVLKCPEKAFCASLLKTMMFHTHTGRNVHRLS